MFKDCHCFQISHSMICIFVESKNSLFVFRMGLQKNNERLIFICHLFKTPLQTFQNIGIGFFNLLYYIFGFRLCFFGCLFLLLLLSTLWRSWVSQSMLSWEESWGILWKELSLFSKFNGYELSGLRADCSRLYFLKVIMTVFSIMHALLTM